MNLKFYITTFGCQMNKSDSERTAKVLEKNGMQKTAQESDADVIIINACSVRQTAIDRIWGKMNKYDALKKKRNNGTPYTILTGCVLPADRPKFKKYFDQYSP